TVRATNPEAAGAVADITMSSGTVVGAGEEGEHSVVLSGDGFTSPAQASFLYYGEEQGTATLNVTAGGVTKSQPITIVGRPTLFPQADTIPGGGSLHLLVLSGPQQIFCQAKPILGATVTMGQGDNEEDLMMGAGPATKSDDDNGVYQIKISVDANLAEPIDISVSCFDIFGQESDGGIYIGEPSGFREEEAPSDEYPPGDDSPDDYPPDDY
ncbi:MAG: hypothetical protein QF464_05860, partial [Myxococcota bacterium]|nr:hypothetical protein [Myxococcota bacterium]